ncbi:MAG TPA: hypothetical protein VIB07_08805 [Nitrososphaera sp.]
MVEFEYVNPLAGLAMIIVGLFLVSFGLYFYGIAPMIVGVVLVIYYRRYLLRLMGA